MKGLLIVASLLLAAPAGAATRLLDLRVAGGSLGGAPVTGGVTFDPGLLDLAGDGTLGAGRWGEAHRGLLEAVVLFEGQAFAADHNIVALDRPRLRVRAFDVVAFDFEVLASGFMWSDLSVPVDAPGVAAFRISEVHDDGATLTGLVDVSYAFEADGPAVAGEVAVTPLPAGLALLLGALASLGVAARRRG